MTERMVRLAAALVVAAAVADELRHVRHRARRSATTWWETVQRREDRRLRSAELAFLVAVLPRKR